MNHSESSDSHYAHSILAVAQRLHEHANKYGDLLQDAELNELRAWLGYRLDAWRENSISDSREYDAAVRKVCVLAMKESKPATVPDAPTTECDHGVTFDEKAAEKLKTHEIRKRWPRLFGVCPKGCGFDGIGYASTAHYVYGDW